MEWLRVKLERILVRNFSFRPPWWYKYISAVEFALRKRRKKKT